MNGWQFPRIALALASICCLCAGTGRVHAQARGISGNGFDSGDIKIVPQTEPAKEAAKTVKTIQFVAVSPERVWKSSDSKQKPITGALLAFAREAETGKVSIVHDKKIRLLVGKKDFTLPLTRLSPDDQAYIQNLEESARVAGKLLEPEASTGTSSTKKPTANGTAGSRPGSEPGEK